MKSAATIHPIQSRVIKSIHKLGLFNFPFHSSHWKWIRLSILSFFDALSVILAYYLAFAFRIDNFALGEYFQTFMYSMPIVLISYMLSFYIAGMYNVVWRLANLENVILIIKCCVIGFITCIAIEKTFFAWTPSVPRSVPLIHCSFVIMLVSYHKFLWRIWKASLQSLENNKKKKCIIYGAGSLGSILARHLTEKTESPYQVVGFIDEDINIKHRKVGGFEVLGDLNELETVLSNQEIETVIISSNQNNGEKVRQIFDICSSKKIKALIMPEMIGSLSEKMAEPRNINLDDLLKRSVKNKQDDRLEQILSQEVVLITGAGGTIGSEICRQVSKLAPLKILLLDASEHNLYQIDREIKNKIKKDIEVIPILASLTNEENLWHLFKKYKPTIVLHAAAYKHVPLVEANPLSGITNNVGGTYSLLKVSIEFGVKRLLTISSDKAVRPTSTMGATKRVCELLVQAMHKYYGNQIKLSLVRFGNVLGSSGSVVPLFMDQIRKGEAVTVTDPSVTRYFMLTNEAVSLVLKSLAINKGGEIFLLDMGEPVSIYEMAKHLIRLSGKEPDIDVPIKFIGMRSGEKLYEELLLEGNEVNTSIPDIFVASPEPMKADDIINRVQNLLKLCHLNDIENAKEELWKLSNGVSGENCFDDTYTQNNHSIPSSLEGPLKTHHYSLTS